MRICSLAALGMMTSCGTPSGDGDAATADAGSESANSATASDDGTGEETGGEAACGDGNVDPGEECDDGNDRNADGCNADCRASGAIEWAVVHGSEGFDTAYGVSAHPSGDVIVAGVFDTGVQTGGDIWVTRVNADGEFVWERFEDGNLQRDYGFAVDTGTDGKIAVAGTVRQAFEDQDPWTGLFDEDGEKLWSTVVVHPEGNDTHTGVVLADDGTVTVASALSEAGASDIVVRQYDDAGVEQWVDSRPIGYDSAGAWPIGPGLAELGEGYLAVFSEALDGNPFVTPWMRKYDVDGTPVDDFVATATRGLFASASDGAVIVAAGVEWNDQGMNGELWVGAYSLAGEASWSQTCGAGTARGLAVDSVGDVIVAGYEIDGAAAVPRVCKYSPSGELRWEQELPAGDRGLAYAVTTSDDDMITVVGELDEAGKESEALIVRIRP